MSIAIIIPAAGGSSRYSEGLEVPKSKLDEDLGGRPVLQRTVELFTNRDDVAHVIVAGPSDDEAFEAFRLRHGDKLSIMGVVLCRGGATHRYESVKAAIEHVPGDVDLIGVHDGARPCASQALIERLFEAARKHGAAIPGVDVADTLKRVREVEFEDDEVDPLASILGDGGAKTTTIREVEETVDRSRLVQVQTPQVFRAELLRRAYAQDDLSSTDDASLVERLGETVVVVAGESSNLKITRPADLRLARRVLDLKGPSDRPTHKKF